MYLFILHEGVGEKVLSAYQSFSLNQGYLMTRTFNAFLKEFYQMIMPYTGEMGRVSQFVGREVVWTCWGHPNSGSLCGVHRSVHRHLPQGAGLFLDPVVWAVHHSNLPKV